MQVIEPAQALDEQTVVTELESAAAERIMQCQSRLEGECGPILVGIEDEFTVHGVSYHREQELIDTLTEELSRTYGNAFSSIDHEHPLIRVRDSILAGKNQALHMPDTFRLELVTNHELIEGAPPVRHAVQKAEFLRDMRKTIMEVVERFEAVALISHSPRPIPDVYYYLMHVNGYEPDFILRDIKRQAEERPDLIGRERILAARTLEEMFLSKTSVLENHGAAGSGVHINIGFKGKDGVNPFYNPVDPDKGTPVTWNAAAGIIDITAESVLLFVNRYYASWERLGNKNLSAPTHAGYHPLKKSGAIVKQNPYTQKFFDDHGLPAKATITPENAHLEIRHADPGFGNRDGAALTMLQIAATLAGIEHGLKQRRIQSYEQLLEYKAPLCADFDEALDKFRASTLLPKLLGERLYRAALNYAELNANRLEGVFDPQTLEAGDREYSYLPEESGFEFDI